jgi:DNA polymerase-3 subunit epsilon
MEDLLEQFDRIVIFDTETTGIEFGRDEIIELGAVCLDREGEKDSMNCLIRLSDGRVLPPFITELTGITDAQLAAEGVEKEEAGRQFCRLLDGAEHPLLVAYNAQFDLNFLYYFLRPFRRLDVLKAARFLDALTVYRDRRDYPHKLCNAIASYGLEDQAVNSHRAVDDARAAAMLLFAMAAEKNDLVQYLDLFGYNVRYGVSGRRISSVTYRAQPYQRMCPLYELSADTL